MRRASIDLALVADRKALIAQTEADAIKARLDAERAANQLQATRESQLQHTERTRRLEIIVQPKK